MCSLLPLENQLWKSFEEAKVSGFIAPALLANRDILDDEEGSAALWYADRQCSRIIAVLS
jgi:hypothetical protein